MGKNNRARRAAKAKRRAREHERSGTRSARGGSSTESARSTEPPLSTPEFIAGLLHLAVGAIRDHESDVTDRAIAQLCTLGPTAVRREAERHVLLTVGAAWSGGWQPTELVRQVRRAANAATVSLSLVAIAAVGGPT